MYHAIFFDIDNTLLLQRPSIPEKVFEIASRHIPAVEFEAVERAYASSELWQGRQIREENESGVRMPDEEYIAHVAEIYGQTLGLSSDAVQELADVFTRGYEKKYVLAPGASEIIQELKEAGIPLGIVSNNHSHIRMVLECMGIAPYFDPIIISEEVGLYKPDGAILELACTRVGRRPEHCLYVGDHPFDILCAHKAHMPVIWLPSNPFMEIPDDIDSPEYTAASLREARDFIIK